LVKKFFNGRHISTNCGGKVSFELLSGSQAPAYEPAWLPNSALLKNPKPWLVHSVAKRGLSSICIPKQELGGERIRDNQL
jgi:hypothetical protein